VTAQAIVVSTDAPRERGCPPLIVLGAKVIEALGVHLVRCPGDSGRAAPGVQVGSGERQMTY
jgi:hypothetical protein